MTNILIVEDEGLIALDLKMKLEQIGYSVLDAVDNATDALLGVESLKPDLVLMDIRLRGPVDGITTADQIRRKFDVPVVFVTAHADSETLTRAKITEPFGYIVKPFYNVDLRPQIEIALWKHKMERKLRYSEAWLSATFRNVAEGLIATDGDGNVAFMNGPASRLTEWDWTEARGRPLLEVLQIFEEKTGVPVVHPLNAIGEGQRVDSETLTYSLQKRSASDPILVEVRFSANREKESFLGIIVAFSEVTERRKTEERNRQLQKMNAVALMATGLGKELDRSHRKMDAVLTELIAEADGDDSLRRLRDLYSLAAAQKAVVQQLIRLGSTESLEVASVDLNAAIIDLEARFRKTLGYGRALTLRLQEGIPPIKVNPDELTEVLLSLVVNARNAIQDGGSVEIATRITAAAGSTQMVCLEIRDSGRGIREHAKEQVFDPYYQSRPGAGSPGISLTLAYQFAASSGGSIEVESGFPEGTAYLLNLPADHSTMWPAVNAGPAVNAASA